ncbi:MAG: substrate-binding domain-containing protein [Saprospiraceae bacterium]|nr:substrate-binding domain-containing protein [Saprospiraceae bacterium]
MIRVIFLKKSNEILAFGPDAIVLAPIFKEEGLTFINTCCEQGIPVALINTQIDAPQALCYIGQDSYQSGIVAARLLNFGVTNGSTALLINIDSMSASAQHLIDKERGFRDYFDGIDGKKVNILTAHFDHGRGKSTFSDFLVDIWKSHPSLNSVFVTNSRAYLLIECLPKKLLDGLSIVGFDLIEPNLQYLQANRINFSSINIPLCRDTWAFSISSITLC